MAITHMDNFSIYGGNTAYMLNGTYAEIGSFSALVPDPSGLPGTVFRMQTLVGFSGVRRILQSLSDVVGVAARYWLAQLPAVPTVYVVPFDFRDASNEVIAYARITTTGRIEVVKGSTVLGATANPVVTPNAFYHLEGRIEIAGASGKIEIRTEGATVLALENVDLGTAPVAQVAVRAVNMTGGNAFFSYFKDLIIWDDSGTRNTDFVGTLFVGDLPVTSDVALNWTPSVGATGYEILDNAPPNAAQYLQAFDPPPAAYVGTLANLPDDVTTVRAVMTVIRAAKVDGGDASLQVGLISDPEGSPETAWGANRPITVAQTYWQDVFEEDPATNAPWTPSGVNDAQLTINRTS